MKKIGTFLLIVSGTLCCQQALFENDLSKDIERDILKHKLPGVDTINLTVWGNDKIPINRDVFGINNDWRKITNDQFPAAATVFKNLS